MTRGAHGFNVSTTSKDQDQGEAGAAYFYTTDGTGQLQPGGRSGARVMGELAAQLVLDAAASLEAQPLQKQEVVAMSAPLPAPMLMMTTALEEGWAHGCRGHVADRLNLTRATATLQPLSTACVNPTTGTPSHARCARYTTMMPPWRAPPGGISMTSLSPAAHPLLLRPVEPGGNEYLDRWAGIPVDDASLYPLPYEWVLPYEDRAAGLGSWVGDESRLRAALQRYLGGDNLTVSFVGGSHTWGAYPHTGLTYPRSGVGQGRGGLTRRQASCTQGRGGGRAGRGRCATWPQDS